MTATAAPSVNLNCPPWCTLPTAEYHEGGQDDRGRALIMHANKLGTVHTNDQVTVGVDMSREDTARGKLGSTEIRLYIDSVGASADALVTIAELTAIRDVLNDALAMLADYGLGESL